MRTAIDVAIVYEHVARELDVACAVRSILRRRHGIRAEIVQWPCGIPEALGRYRPALVMLPFCYTRHDYPHLPMDWRRSIFLNLAWEQLLSEAVKSIKMPSDEFALRHVVHHAWGEERRSLLIGLGVPAEYIVVNGHPGYTLFQTPYRNYFKGREALARTHRLDPEKRWVLFPENYYWGYCEPQYLQRLVKSVGEQTAAAARHYCRDSIKTVGEWLSRVADEAPVEVIVRPRPIAPLETFRGVVHELVPSCSPRVQFIKAETIRDWILASDLTVSSYSTTLLEAAVADKPSYALEPAPIPAVLRMPWSDRMPVIADYDDLTAACAAEAVPPSVLEAGRWVRQSLMGTGDAIAGIADIAAGLLSGSIPAPPPIPRWKFTPPGRLPLPRSLLHEYRRFRYRNRRWDRSTVEWVVPRYSDDIVGADEIELRTRRWDDLLQAGVIPAAQLAS